MDRAEYFEFVLNGLRRAKGIRSDHASGGREAIVRCPYCGDSDNLGHAHLYVSLTDMPSVFHCFRCTESGIVGERLFKDLGVHDAELFGVLAKINKGRREKGGRRKASDMSLARTGMVGNGVNIPEDGFTCPYFRKSDEIKLEHLHDRGIPIFESMAADLRIVFDLKRFLMTNDIHAQSLHSDHIGYVSRNYLGFLMADNESILFRRIQGDGVRHFWYDITGSKDRRRRLYAIPKKLDLMEPVVEVNVAEGCFDAIGAWRINGDRPSAVYFAAMGKKFSAVLDLLMGMGFLSMEVNIWADSDDGNERIARDLKRSEAFRALNPKVTVMRNAKGKDFGIKNVEIVKRTLFSGMGRDKGNSEIAHRRNPVWKQSP